MFYVLSYNFPGDHCELQDHCASQPCRNGAECKSLDGTYKCLCARGFSGANCQEDIDECAAKPCRQGKCLNTYGTYS